MFASPKFTIFTILQFTVFTKMNNLASNISFQSSPELVTYSSLIKMKKIKNIYILLPLRVTCFCVSFYWMSVCFNPSENLNNIQSN